jgi:hypothetical protein
MLDPLDLEALASDPIELLRQITMNAEKIIGALVELPPPVLAKAGILERFAALREIHRCEANLETAALLQMLMMGQKQLADGRVVSLEEAIAYAKGHEGASLQRLKFAEIEEATPGPISDQEWANVLAGGTRKDVPG